MIKVLIADDHKIFRKGLRQTIDDQPDMRVTGEAVDGHQALEQIRTDQFDVAVLDISMPGPTIFELIEHARLDRPHFPILVLTMHPEEQYAVRLLKAGASGYLTKDADEGTLAAAIRKAFKGGKYISSALAEQLALSLENGFERTPHESLSNREYQVMLLLAKGKSVTAIAQDLNLGVTTVSTYRTRILEKMHLQNNAQLIRYAFEAGLIS